MFIAKETDTWSKKHRVRLTEQHKAKKERRELHSQCARHIHLSTESVKHTSPESSFSGARGRRAIHLREWNIVSGGECYRPSHRTYLHAWTCDRLERRMNA